MSHHTHKPGRLSNVSGYSTFANYKLQGSHSLVTTLEFPYFFHIKITTLPTNLTHFDANGVGQSSTILTTASFSHVKIVLKSINSRYMFRYISPTTDDNSPTLCICHQALVLLITSIFKMWVFF